MMDNSQGSNLKRLDVPNDSRKYAVGTNPQEEGENGERRQISYEHSDIQIPDKSISSGDVKWNLNIQV